MQWIQNNPRMFLGIAGVVVWLAMQAGPSALSLGRKAVAAAWPKVKQANLGKAWPLLLLVGVMFWPADHPIVKPVEPARVPDIVDQCGASGRALLADALTDFAGQKFDTDQAREDAINEKIGDVIEASFSPLNEQIAKAIKFNRVTECAELIRKGDLRE
jgi:hypothetical protein